MTLCFESAQARKMSLERVPSDILNTSTSILGIGVKRIVEITPDLGFTRSREVYLPSGAPNVIGQVGQHRWERQGGC